MIRLALIALTVAVAARAEVKPTGWRHESEVAVARATGNAETETYSAKQTTAYQFETSIARLNGHYLYGTARGVENARNWDVVARYEKELSPSNSAYLFHSYESDRFIGFDLRIAAGAGLKYFFYDVDRDKQYAFVEGGYTFAHEERIPGNPIPTLNSHFARAYVETLFPVTETTSLKAGLEVLQDLAQTNNLQINLDTSVAVSMTKVLALKAGYIVRYRSTPAVVGNQNLDGLLAMSLIAKFVPDAK